MNDAHHFARRMSDLGTGSRLFAGGFGAKVVLAAVLLVAYLGLEWLSSIHEYKGLPVTPWNPGLGVMFAALILTGPFGALALFAGVLGAEFFVMDSDLSWPQAAAAGALSSGSYLAASEALRRGLKFDPALHHLRDVLLLLAAGLAGATASAALLTALLVLSGEIALADILDATVPLLVGDVIGVAVITPLLLRAAHLYATATTVRVRHQLPEILAYLAAIFASLLVITGMEGTTGFRFFYLLFIPVVVAAVRYGLDGACLSLAVTQFGLIGLLQLHGHDARAFTELQSLMFVLSATGLIVGVIVRERETSYRRAREAEARLKEREDVAAQAARLNLVNGLASALSHEINQPMTAIRALARSVQHILQTPGGDLKRAAENVATMIAQIDHASSVIRRVREFVRRGQPHTSTIDVASMLEEALLLIRPEAAARGIRIEKDVARDLPAVHGDRIQLEQVVLNLVRNAIEAIASVRRPDGRVRIAARCVPEPAAIEIAVSDNGPGIEATVADTLFAPLTTSKDEGLGLGLPISASIIEAHGGTLRLHASEAGATEFRFLLPLQKA